MNTVDKYTVIDLDGNQEVFDSYEQVKDYLRTRKRKEYHTNEVVLPVGSTLLHIHFVKVVA